MKKIAFFVEGQTEMYFINRLMIEIAGQKNISIKLKQFYGGKTIPKVELHKAQTSSYSEPISPKYEALIYDCTGDNRVQSDILDNISSLAASGYDSIIGIRDLYPLTDLNRVKSAINFVKVQNSPLPINYEIVVATNEVEAWFISECNHFLCIHPSLTATFINTNLGFNPCTDDISLRTNPASDLSNIYRLVGMRYNKTKANVERTVECIDYSNLYLSVRNRATDLNELMDLIDDFLT